MAVRIPFFFFFLENWLLNIQLYITGIGGRKENPEGNDRVGSGGNVQEAEVKEKLESKKFHEDCEQSYDQERLREITIENF